jgi:hypothetical protein
MKSYYKECQNMKQINSFLEKVTGWDWFDTDCEIEDFDQDCWINQEETKGLSVQVHKDGTVFVTKYTRKDIEQMEAELA